MKKTPYGSAQEAAVALHNNEGLAALGLENNIEIWAVINGESNSIIEVSTGFDSNFATGVYDGAFDRFRGDSVWHTHPNGGPAWVGDYNSRMHQTRGLKQPSGWIFASGSNLSGYQLGKFTYSQWSAIGSRGGYSLNRHVYNSSGWSTKTEFYRR